MDERMKACSDAERLEVTKSQRGGDNRERKWTKSLSSGASTTGIRNMEQHGITHNSMSPCDSPTCSFV